MAALPTSYVAFSLTIATPGTFSLYNLLSTGTAPTGTTLGAALSATFTGKTIPTVIIQNDPASTAGSFVYVGDSTVSATNKGYSLSVGSSVTLDPARGSNAWVNGIYFTSTTAASLIVNFIIIYG